MGYLIKKEEKAVEIVCFDDNFNGYEFKPNINKDKYISVNKINIIDPKTIDNILCIKFDKLYKALAHKVYIIISDDDSNESDTRIVLDELAKLRDIILHKYQKFLSQEKEELFLKKIKYLENGLRVKLLEVNNYVETETMEKHRSR